MVGHLKYKKTDPNRKGRGAGLYYHRGNGVFSKYTPSADAKKYHRRTVVRDVPAAEKHMPHMHDYKTKGRGVVSARVGGRGPKGYF